jgi:hypothetical protein
VVVDLTAKQIERLIECMAIATVERRLINDGDMELFQELQKMLKFEGAFGDFLAGRNKKN